MKITEREKQCSTWFTKKTNPRKTAYLIDNKYKRREKNYMNLLLVCVGWGLSTIKKQRSEQKLPRQRREMQRSETTSVRSGVRG